MILCELFEAKDLLLQLESYKYCSIKSKMIVGLENWDF